jgi:hypothetical protein
VLSRLDYPGYSISGAAKVDPARGWLLTVDVSDASPGDTVVVTFRPPGFALIIAALVLAGVLAVVWPLLRTRRRRRELLLRADWPVPTAVPGTRG